MIIRPILALLSLSGVLVATSAAASVISWTQWTGDNGTNTATGNLMVGATSVNVTASGNANYGFVQTTSGTDYWLPDAPYLSSTVSNAPTGPGIVALNSAVTETITFSQAIEDPLIALVSWNGANVTFPDLTAGQYIDYLSSGCGYWGCGTYGSPTSDSFTGVGELHGVIELVGDYTSITFTDTVDEYWHGFTVGVVGLASPGPGPTVPEPGSLMLVGLGLSALAFAKRKR